MPAASTDRRGRLNCRRPARQVRERTLATRLRGMRTSHWLCCSLLAAALPAQVGIKDLPGIARGRAERLRPLQERALQQFWQDLAMDYRDNREYLDQRIREVAALGDVVVPLLLEKLHPAASSTA